MDKIAVLIPCYNESKTIEKVVTDFKKVLPEAVIYVYDNNSTDHTDEIARRAGAVVRYEYQQGKGNVIRRMFREIDAQCYIMADGDDTYPAEFAPSMVKKVLNKKVDMVVGDRLSSTYFTENKRPFHNFGNSLVRKCINIMFKTQINDIMTGYRAFSYQFVKSFPVLSKGFEIETEMSIHAVDKNMYIENEVIEYRDRPEGSESKLNTYSDGFRVLKTIAKLYRNYKPMAFFGLMAAVLLILGIGFFIPVFVTFLETGRVGKIPTLIVCGFAVLGAIQSLFSGLVLQTMVQKNRQDFEMELGNAGEHEKRVEFCSRILEMLNFSFDDGSNFKSAIGEELYAEGKIEQGRKWFEDWLKKEPHNQNALSVWSWCVQEEKGAEEAYKIIRREVIGIGCTMENELLFERARLLAQHLEKAEDLKWIESQLEVFSDTLEKADIYNDLYDDFRMPVQKPIVKEKKVYPNDPCPCGSGKKYKKCCGKKQ